MKIMLSKMIKITIFLMAMGIYFSIAPLVSFAQNPPAPDSTDAQREGVRRAFQRFGLNWQRGEGVGVNRDGRVTGLRGIPFSPDSSFSLLNWTYNFLERNADLFGIPDPRHEFVLLFDHGHTVRLQQVNNGIKIEGALIQTEISADSTYLSGLTVYYYPEANNLNATPSIDSLQAKTIALSDTINRGLNPPPSIGIPPRLLIKKFDDGFHLIWFVAVWGGGYCGTDQYFIDAHTGQVLFAGCAAIMN